MLRVRFFFHQFFFFVFVFEFDSLSFSHGIFGIRISLLISAAKRRQHYAGGA